MGNEAQTATTETLPTVAAPNAGALAAFDYGADAKAGLENVTQEDLSIPFLTVLQANSPQVAGDPAQRVKGASAGMLYNTVTHELFDGEVGVVLQPSALKHVYVEWRPRQQGGGYVASHELTSALVAKVRAEQKFGEYKTEAGNELQETVYLLCLIHQSADLAKQVEIGIPPAIMATFSSTKMRPYKNFMYRVMSLSGGKIPLFAHRIRVQTVMEKNSQGTYFNYKLTGVVNDDLAASLIPPKDGEQPHPLLVAGRELNKRSGVTISANYSNAKTEKPAGGADGAVDDIPF